jgi:fimbrial isopeptide formation D2 family protein/LPXTG-motif cell wall-anchored protein
MKKLKKAAGVILALALALVTLLGTGTAVRAEDATSATGNSLTIKNTGATAHTFELYQIFTGDLIEDSDTGTKTLSNVQWGDGVTKGGQTHYDKASKKAEELTSENVKSFADELIKLGYLQNGTVSDKIGPGKSHTFDHLSAGYYLVVDVASSQTYDETVDERKSAYTAYIFQVVGSVTQDIKIDVPTISKHVYNNNDSESEAVTNPQDVPEEEWHDKADHDVGDSIPYHIVGTLPSNYDEYETYKTYTITDTLSEGLTAPAPSTVKVFLNSEDESGKAQRTEITDKFDISVNKQILTVALRAGGDMKNITRKATDKIEVFYNAILNDQSVIGGSGNPNTVNLQYSNNPNQGGDGDKGKTPDDRNVVFTYQLNINKFKENQDAGNKTNEATFKLFKEMKNGDAKEVPITNGTDKTYMASRLDDGKYILQEAKAPDGYNKMDGTVEFGGQTYENAVEFEIKAEYDGAVNPHVTKLEAVGIRGAEGVKFEGNISTGIVSTNIIDQKGSSLPTTGGIGTTIFYVIGSVLVIGAGVLLITRRRMNKKS